jgi:hypothetical protein
MKVDLLQMLARICYHAQETLCDPELNSTDICDRGHAFLATSYVIACFLAEYTVDGHYGVETEIVLDYLVDTTESTNGLILTSIDKWKDIITNIVNSYGGFKE